MARKLTQIYRFPLTGAEKISNFIVQFDEEMKIYPQGKYNCFRQYAQKQTYFSKKQAV